MTIKVYISGICGSQEVRKQQQRALFILQSLPIDLQVIDITEPGKDGELAFMQEEVKKHDKKSQLPPQIFNGDKYCGDYTDFDLANDDDKIMQFLQLVDTPNGIGGTHQEIKEETEHLYEQHSLNGLNGESEAVEQPESETFPTGTIEESEKQEEDVEGDAESD